MYKGLPIITNKVTEEEKRGVPHHLLDFIDLKEDTWTVHDFLKQGQKIIEDIHCRQRLPILVGGTHYYQQSLLLKDAVISDDVEKKRVERDGVPERSGKFSILDGPIEDIYEMLQKVDPEQAKRWHPKDRLKIARSLEIWLKTGKRASDIYSEQRQNNEHLKMRGGRDEERLRYNTILFWLHADREVLDTRLDKRVHEMMATGLVEEAQEMEKLYHDLAAEGEEPDLKKGIWQSIGYKELKPYLIAQAEPQIGQQNLQQTCVESVQAATRQYAKRQIRWIRLKLLNELIDASLLEHFFLLDGTDLEDWDEAVTTPSETIITNFLSGGILPLPRTLSPTAAEILPDASGSIAKRQEHVGKRCTECEKVLVTQEQYDMHMKSRQHKKVVEGIARRKHNEEARLANRKDQTDSEANG